MTEFKVGDRCQIVPIDGQDVTPEDARVAFNTDVVVIMELDYRPGFYHHRPMHLVRLPGFGNGAVWERHLRKLPPPIRQQTSTWNDVIVWRPKETQHV